MSCERCKNNWEGFTDDYQQNGIWYSGAAIPCRNCKPFEYEKYRQGQLTQGYLYSRKFDNSPAKDKNVTRALQEFDE